MNLRARQLGLTNTRFTNACGHDAPGHYASVKDIALLALAAMQVEQIARWVAQAQTRITTMNRQRSYTLKTTNALIGRYDGVLGVKTGTTPKAGKCLVALVGRGRHEVMLVMLKGRDRWWDAVDVLDIAFARAQANATANAHAEQ
jgi:D-alanyl-D-alanine carboxypeptidase (penicillin-binding protein 5/6)